MRSPVSVHFEVTDCCNSHCPHCYASSWLASKRRRTPRLGDVASAIASAHVFDVTITGGEPLIVGPDVIHDLAMLFAADAIECSLNTNGRLLTPATCVALGDAGISSLLISLHSWNEALHDEIVATPHAAAQAKKGIRNAIAAGLRVVVNQVVDQRNIGGLLSTSTELARLGVHAITLTRALPPLGSDHSVATVGAAEFIDAYEACRRHVRVPVSTLLPIPFCADPRVKDLPGNRACSGGYSTAVVSCDGDVRFCPHDTRVWGNVLDDSLQSIWGQMTEWRSAIDVPADCERCAFLPDCGGGCRLAARTACGDYQRSDPWATRAETRYQRRVVFAEFETEVGYTVSSDIRWREEGGSYLLYSSGQCMFVDRAGLSFLQGLPGRFMPSLVWKNESQLEFLRDLYRQGFIKRSEEISKPAASAVGAGSRHT